VLLLSDSDKEYSYRNGKGSLFLMIGLEVESFEGFDAAG
jgi:hypothetical protein